MKKSSPKQLFIFIGVLITALGGYYLFNSSSTTSQRPPDKLLDTPFKIDGSYVETEIPKNSRYAQSGNINPKSLEKGQDQQLLAKKKTPGVIDEFQKARKRQLALNLKRTNDFKSLAQIKMKLPKNLSFMPLDVDDGIAALRGTGTGAIKDMTILASKKRVDTQQVVTYLNAGDTGVPVAKNGGFKLNTQIKIKAPSGSGIRNITVIDNRIDPGLKAAFVTRSDGQGNYLFLIKADSSFFNSNEGFLEQILGSMKTQ
jgi:hypothetical protein